MSISEHDIAMMSKLQIDAKNNGELKNYCKILELRQYSRLKHNQLANMVYEATNIKRQMLTATVAIGERRREKSVEAILENAKKDSPMSLRVLSEVIEACKRNHGYSGGESWLREIVARDISKELYKLCGIRGYKDLTIGKNKTRELKSNLTLLVEQKFLTKDFSNEIKNCWDEQVKGIHIARKKDDLAKIKGYAINSETIQENDAIFIINWAIEHLFSERIYLRGMAIAILTGRRQSEIFFTETQYQAGEVGIFVTGLLKGKKDYDNSAEIIPLHPPKIVLKAINTFEKRDEYKAARRSHISTSCSNQIPDVLFNRGIKKFKDMRAFYSAVIFSTFSSFDPDNALQFSQWVMGHKKIDNTLFYKEFDVPPIKPLIPVCKEWIEKVFNK